MNVRSVLQRVRAAGWWKPSAAAVVLRSAVRGTDVTGVSPVSTDHDALVGAAGWLARAQDANRDGGISGRYRL